MATGWTEAVMQHEFLKHIIKGEDMSYVNYPWSIYRVEWYDEA